MSHGYICASCGVEWFGSQEDHRDCKGPWSPLKDMRLRDYFAGQAVAGLLFAHRSGAWVPEEIATLSYKLADGMLQAREAKS